MEWMLLSGLSEADRSRLVALMTRRHYGRGESVFSEGDPADCLHFIASGHVIVRRTTPAGDRAAFTVMGPGEAFGELALLSPQARRTSSVAALEPTSTHTLGAPAFRDLTRERPEFSRVLVEVLSARVTRLSDHLVEALYARVEQRVARRLVHLCGTYGVDRGEVVLPITQSDLADMAGASRPATNRVLQGLAAAGSVTLSRGRIHVHSVEALRSVP
jgi:CRP/FNR family transcriptional regulator, cyclic AMP receptor protein